MDTEMDGSAAREAALLSEIEQLRRQLAGSRHLAVQAATDTINGVEVQRQALARSRQETSDAREDAVQARGDAIQARGDAAGAVVEHAHAMATSQAELGSSRMLNAALQASENRFRLMLESATDFAIITLDTDGCVTGWNTGASNVMGWSEAELLGHDAGVIWTPEDRAALVPEEEMRDARETGRASDERWHLKRDGTRFWASGTMSPMHDDAGGLLGYLKILRDRTEQHLTGQALRLAERRRTGMLKLGEQLRDMEDAGEMASMAAESLGHTMDVNAAGYGTLDHAGEVLSIEREWTAPGFRSVTGFHRLRNYGSYLEALQRGETVAVDDVSQDPRTSTGAGELEALGVRAFINLPLIEHGRLVAMFFVLSETPRVWTPDKLAFVRNVAERVRGAIERRRAEHDLRELAASLEAQVEERTRERDRLWELSEDLLVVADYDGHLLRVSPSWTRLLGHDEKTLLTRPYSEMVHPDDLGPVTDALLLMRSTGKPAHFQDRMVSADGSWRWIAWTLSPEPCGEGLTGVGRDITADKAAAEARARLEEQLRQSQKMEAVGQLTGGLAHDFNNLLTGIGGSLELLQARIAQGRIKDVDRYVTAAQGAARRAAALTHRLLAFSRQQTLDPRPTDVNRLVVGMEELVRRTMGPGIRVEVVTAGGLWNSLVDPGQLENALLNLCINARDAMPQDGSLTIETGNKWLDERGARERELLPGQYVILCVSDNGTGMAPEIIARAFDPFFTTKPVGQGTGLGLSMIYGFVRQSGGQVRIYSEVGHGTMVCLYLPRHHGTAEEAEQPAELAEAPRAERGETVLVVDDEPTVRMLVTEVLEDLGYTAIEVADGAAGLKVLRSGARIDLLVTDVGLPGGMNGRQVADAARVMRPDLKVLFITGFAENAVLSHGHLDPGMHILTKPFAMEALASRIRELIAGR